MSVAAPLMTISEARRDPTLFAPWFRGDTWRSWDAFLAGLFGHEMTEQEAEAFRKYTGRSVIPQVAAREGWVIVGRRGGKSLIAGFVAVFLACFRDYASFLGPGEVATVMVIAADRRQARVIMRYIAGFITEIPMLSALEAKRTKESIELSNRVVIEVHTANFRAVRGYTLAAAVCDELGFWRSDESANPDTEVLSAIRPGLATIPNSLLLCISSPYARRGALWEAYRRHFGKDDDRVLVWQAATREMNPSVPQEVIDEAMLEDESAARAEFLAEFRRDIETFINREAVEAIVIRDRFELPPCSDHRYFAFVDPSGGSSDSMTMAIAHREKQTAVLDLVREWKPPFSPERVTAESCGLMSLYRISRATGDRYGGQWPRERFRVHGIEYDLAEKSKSEIYGELLPKITSEQVELLDNARLISQLLQLERRTARSGKDSIDHAPNGHDDLVNAAAGALLLASGFGKPTGGVRKARWA